MTSTTRNVLAALVVLLLSAGVALAIVQPGDLGDDESASGTSSSSTSSSTTTEGETPTTETPTTEIPTTDTTATQATDPPPPPPPTTATTDGSVAPGSTSTTDTTAAPVPGGGLAGSGGADAVGSNIANTGGESTLYLLGAVVLAALGLLARRVSRQAS